MTLPSYNPDSNFDDDPLFQPMRDQASAVQLSDGRRLVNETAGVRILTDPAVPPALDAQPAPTYIMPRRYRTELLDRGRELQLAGKALDEGQSVEFYGPAGAGKSLLMHYLADRVPDTQFSDGIFSLSAHLQDFEDLQQVIFDLFFASDPPLLALSDDVQQRLQAKQALILLDDVNLSGDDKERLLALVPNCTFLMASQRHDPYTKWQTIPVSELPADDARTLAERAINRTFSPEEISAVRTICTILRNQPLNILQIISHADTNNIALVSLAQQLRETPTSQDIATLLSSSFTEDEQNIISVLAAMNGVPLTREQLTDLTGIISPTSILRTLSDRYLVVAEDQRYSLLGTLNETLKETLDLSPWIDTCLTHFVTWAERNRQDSGLLLTEVDALIQAIHLAADKGQWHSVLRLVRPLDQALFLDRRWGTWKQVLDWGLQAAQTSGDQQTEAWALHQLGTRAISLKHEDEAIKHLSDALQLRSSIGEQTNIDLTRHNLDIIGGDSDFAGIPLMGGGGPPTGGPPDGPNTFYTENMAAGANGRPRSNWLPALLGLLLIGGLIALALYLARFSISQQIQTQATTVPEFSAGEIQVSSQNLKFNALSIGGQNPPQTIIVTNRSNEELTIPLQNIAVSGENAAAFNVTDTDCAIRVLKKDESCSINLAYDPQLSSGQQASLRIGDEGSAQTISLTMAQSSTLVFEPDALYIGHQQIDVSSIPLPVTAINNGSEEVTIVEVEVDTMDDPQNVFFITVDYCTWNHLGPGESCQVFVICLPQQYGEFWANLNITTDNPNITYQIPLHCGTPPTPTPTPIPTATPLPTPTSMPCNPDWYGKPPMHNPDLPQGQQPSDGPPGYDKPSMRPDPSQNRQPSDGPPGYDKPSMRPDPSQNQQPSGGPPAYGKPPMMRPDPCGPPPYYYKTPRPR